jgi:hypothetical protein
LLAKANKQTLHASREDARNKRQQKLSPPATHPVIAKILSRTESKNSCFLRLPRVLAFLEARLADV